MAMAMKMKMKMKTAANTACNSFARQSKYVPKPANCPTPCIRRVTFPVLGGLVDGFSPKSVFLAAGSTGGIRAVHTMEPANEKGGGEAEKSPRNWKIKMLYDGDCPLCMREVDMLRERNKSYGTIKFVDISSDEYSPEDNHGLDYETAMGRIHAIMADGTVVTDVEAFRRLYEQVGLGWVYAITKYEPIGKLADSVYAFWAKYRLQVTGRPPLEQVLEARRKKSEACKDSNACKL